MSPRLTSVSVVCFVATLGTAIAQQATQPKKTTWVAPAGADARANPLANRSDTVPGGRRIFLSRCSHCHGKDGTGAVRGPNLMSGRVQEQNDGALFWKITSGNTRTGMPTFSFLPELQRWQVVTYLRSEANALPKSESGVDDGVRTRDFRSHSPALCH